jgi:hypothetical protein
MAEQRKYFPKLNACTGLSRFSGNETNSFNLYVAGGISLFRNFQYYYNIAHIYHPRQKTGSAYPQDGEVSF